ncbi:MAG: hypothetical protein KIT13_04050 [Burkholderiales bacterium]|nr:hypothetical protein [Burkholderiales bacterium]
MAEEADWIKLENELVRLFKRNGAVGGGGVRDLIDAELHCGRAAVNKFAGHQILSDSFKAFCIETLQSLKVPPSRPFAYANHVAQLSFLVKHLRASEILYLNGYPWQGYSLLRVMVEQAQIRCAVLQGLYDDQEVMGLVNGELPESEKDILKNKKNVECKIFREMSGAKSGLSSEVIARLRHWDDMFDYEIHGLKFSSLEAMDWLKGDGGLSILPTFSLDGATMYVNRYAEVAWMLHRLIPLLQLRPFSLSKDWAEKWQALDNSFMSFSKSMAGIGRPIGLAIIELVTKKFPFDASSHFPVESTENSDGIRHSSQ